MTAIPWPPSTLIFPSASTTPKSVFWSLPMPCARSLTPPDITNDRDYQDAQAYRLDTFAHL